MTITLSFSLIPMIESRSISVSDRITPKKISPQVHKIQTLISTRFPTVLLVEIATYLNIKDFTRLFRTCKQGSDLDRNLMLWKYIAINEIGKKEIEIKKNGKDICKKILLEKLINFGERLPINEKLINCFKNFSVIFSKLHQLMENEMKKKYYQNSTDLNLRSCSLKEIPSYFLFPKKLKSLDLSATGLREFPESICELKKIKTISFDLNKIITLPDSVGKLTNVRYLSLESNYLKTLPDSFSLLKNLKMLFLGTNHFTEVPSCIQNLTNLVDLRFNSNRITHFPPFLGKLVNLTFLDFYDNKLFNIPDLIVPLNNLKAMDLSRNNLKEWPSWISKLARVTRIIL